jgi:hypothetical protein
MWRQEERALGQSPEDGASDLRLPCSALLFLEKFPRAQPQVPAGEGNPSALRRFAPELGVLVWEVIDAAEKNPGLGLNLSVLFSS